MKYMATVTTVFEIEAENVVQAKKLCAKFRTIPEVLGGRRIKNNRESLCYETKRLSHTVKLHKVTGG